MTISKAAMELGSPEFWESIKNDPAALAYEVCRIDMINLQMTLQGHASLRAWVGAVFEQARVEEERAKWELTKTRASALLAARGVDPLTQKAKTVGAMDAEVEMNPAVIQAQERCFAATEKRGALRAMVDALSDRKDMLVQIAAKMREEQHNY